MKQCGECEFFVECGARDGDCHESPPKVFMRTYTYQGGQVEHLFESARPEVKKNDKACSRWVKRDTFSES